MNNKLTAAQVINNADCFQVQWNDNNGKLQTRDFFSFGKAKHFAAGASKDFGFSVSISPLDTVGNDLGLGAWWVSSVFGRTQQHWESV